MADRSRAADPNRTPVAIPADVIARNAPRSDIEDFAANLKNGVIAGDALSVQPGINMLKNPGFENGLEGWTISGSTGTTFSALCVQGTQSLQVQNGAGSSMLIAADPVPVVPGNVYEAKASFFLFTAAGTRPTAVLFVLWYDANGVFISQADTDKDHRGLNSWGQCDTAGIAPANAATAVVQLAVVTGVPADVYLIDDCFFGAGSEVVSYLLSRDQTIGSGKRVEVTNKMRLWSGHPNEDPNNPGFIAGDEAQWNSNQDDDQVFVNIQGGTAHDGSPGPSVDVYTKSKSGAFVNRIELVGGRVFPTNGLEHCTAGGGTDTDFFTTSTATYVTGSFCVPWTSVDTRQKIGVQLVYTTVVTTLDPNQTVRIRAALSFDAGATWTFGQEVLGMCGVGAGGCAILPMTASCGARAFPTNDVWGRLDCRVDGGTPSHFNFQHIGFTFGVFPAAS